MGEEAADTLMDQLPPSGWDQMATKDDLAGVEQRLQASLAVALPEINAKFAEIRGLWLDAVDRGNPIDGAVEGCNVAYASGLG